MQGLPEVPGITHSRVRAGDISMHVAEAGEGPPVLLVHGWPQHWYCWRHVIPELAKSHRVICPDLRGLGWSDAPPRGYDKQTLADDLRHLLDAMALDHVAYVGHDWGAYAGYLLATSEPDRIERLAILDIVTPGNARPRLTGIPFAPWFMSYQFILAAPVLGPKALSATSALLQWVFKFWPSVDLDDVEPYFERLREPERAHASGLYYRSYLLKEMLGRSAHREPVAPILRVMGEHDFIRRLAHDEPGTHVIPGAGHFVPEEAPEALLEVLVPFLNDERSPDGRPSAVADLRPRSAGR